MNKLLRRFREFGSWRLVRAYWRMGALSVAFRQGVKVVLGITKLDDAYQPVLSKVASSLYTQYHPLLLSLRDHYSSFAVQQAPSPKERKIWFCWLQGIEEAPALVRACLNSIRRNIPEWEVIVISLDNYRNYVEVPSEIEEKFRRGIIPKALFSDMLRVALLCLHGGTWMDASLLCTSHNFPPSVLDCDLFLFQHLQPGEYRFRGTSNWFITARPQNPLLLVLRDMLYQYWRDHDCTLNYYIFHQFFAWIAQEYPNEIAAMPRGNRLPPLQLGARLDHPFDADWWNRFTNHCAFHKLNFRVAERIKHPASTYYAHILEQYGTE